ncbi:uncharacterized protein [Tursiops truncatus]|uniref:Uncharacterized protein LOC109547366 isoform X2 n=1 Tax=Tursiops truncatus TaxID=9739 RepID=A0A2U4A2N9_TURTR|nr:uncharacterized protein LOC109547366 isoform X2 [Tursiops truncatus]
MLPALPRAQALHRRRPRSLVLRARGLRCCAAPAEAVAGAGMSYRRMLQRGARRPPQSTRARIPQKFGSGSVGSEMQPKHRFTEPRANKHAQALTQTSPRPALAAADPGHGRPRKSPGPGRGRCLRLKVQGVAARDRPLKGATSKGKLELQEGKSGVSNNISLPEEMKTEGKAIEYSSWMHGGIVSLDRTSIHCMGFEVRILVPETYQFLLCNSAKEVVIIRKMSQWKREYTTHGTALEEQPRPQDFSGKMTAYNVEDGPKGRADLEAKDYYSNP